MNISVLGVIPWRELAAEADTHTRMYTMATFMERLYGHGAAAIVVILIAAAALASVFALLLGYSRIPFAAAKDGNFPASLRTRPPQTPHPPHRAAHPRWSHACLLRLPAAGGHHDAGRDPNPLPVSPSRNGGPVAQASPRTQAPRLPDASLSIARDSRSQRLSLYPVVKAEFSEGDAYGRLYPDCRRAGLFGAILPIAKTVSYRCTRKRAGIRTPPLPLHNFRDSLCHHPTVHAHSPNSPHSSATPLCWKSVSPGKVLLIASSPNASR